MRIEQSNIYMVSERNMISRVEERESLSVMINPVRNNNENDTVNISGQARCKSEKCGAEDDALKESDVNDLKMLLRKLLAELLSGRKVRLLDASDFGKKAEDADQTEEDVQEAAGPESQRQGWGISYDYQKSSYEKENVSFTASGIIKTVDEKEIEFSLHLEMDREYYSYESLSFRAGDAALVDPLVINFNGTAAQLSDVKFLFDLDSDGIDEEMPVLSPGSGFLAIDMNGDGRVNNGSELFGPQTGNGFLELSAHDLDANSWIDENDPVYNRLFVWTMNNEGNSNLKSLYESGIGAINTGNLSTMFDLKGNGNELLGQTVRTGVYLNEIGTAGTIQQLDLAV